MASILENFDENKDRYESFAKSIRSLLSSLMLNEGINVHSISSRVKDRESLEKKIKDKGNYNEIGDITDVVGLRVITHFADEVDMIAEIIESEFKIDRTNSIDKRASLEPDRFGYLSLHYVIELDQNRKKLKEHMLYKDFKAEVQIRSILQHTWAEIEHDIGYKSSIEVPNPIIRQFSRLAGLLELADSEFINIKKALAAYKEEVAERIGKNATDQNISLDSISYREYLKASPIIKDICEEIESETAIPIILGKSGINPIKHLYYFKVTTIKELDDAFRRMKNKVQYRAINVINELDKNIYKRFPMEIMGLYLAQALAAEDGSLEKTKEYLIKNQVKNPDKAEEFAKKLLSIFYPKF